MQARSEGRWSYTVVTSSAWTGRPWLQAPRKHLGLTSYCLGGHAPLEDTQILKQPGLVISLTITQGFPSSYSCRGTPHPQKHHASAENSGHTCPPSRAEVKLMPPHFSFASVPSHILLSGWPLLRSRQLYRFPFSYYRKGMYPFLPGPPWADSALTSTLGLASLVGLGYCPAHFCLCWCIYFSKNFMSSYYVPGVEQAPCQEWLPLRIYPHPYFKLHLFHSSQ